MWCGRRIVTKGMLLLAGLTGARPVWAEGAQFRAPPECALEEDFMSLVRARLPLGVADIPSFQAVVVRDKASFHGEMAVGSSAPRQLTGESCVEVVEAMAIILALRAERLHEERLEAASSRRFPTLSEPLVHRVAPSLADSSPGVSPRAPDGRARFEARAETVRVRLGAGGVLLTDVAPGSAFGPALAAGIESARPEGWALRLGVDRTATGSVVVAPAAIWTRLSVVRLWGCPLGVGFGSVEVHPCVQAAGGVFEAGALASAAIPAVRGARRPWFSLGPALHLTLPITAHLALGAEAAAVLPLVSQKLTFRTPDTTIHERKALTAFFGLMAEIVFGRSNRRVPGIAR
jgi:hypothetical protein